MAMEETTEMALEMEMDGGLFYFSFVCSDGVVEASALAAVRDPQQTDTF